MDYYVRFKICRCWPLIFKNSALFDPCAFSSLQDPRGDISGVQQGMITLVLVSLWMRLGTVRRGSKAVGCGGMSETHHSPLFSILL